MARRFQLVMLALILAVAACGTATPAEHSYVTAYEVVGDRSVKYIYLPGEQARAGGSYLDQALAMEICTLVTAQDGTTYETDCKQTKILRTEEFR